VTHRKPLLLPALLCLCGSLAGQAATEELSPLPEAELEARRKALAGRIFEPAVLEASSFRLSFERASSSILIEDRRTGIGWHSSLARKGFASILLRGAAASLPVDRVDGLRIDEKEIRFRGRSSLGELPEILFHLRVLDPLVGLEISYEVSGPASDRIDRVRLLDGTPWIADADEGGVLLPRGFGEWLAASDAPAGRWRFRRDDGPWLGEASGGKAAAGSAERALVSALGLVRGTTASETAATAASTAALLVLWETPGSELEIARTPSDAAGFPGRGGFFPSVEIAGPRGVVKLFPLGKGDAIDICHSYRQLMDRGRGILSLRRKTEAREELRGLIGAAVLRPVLRERNLESLAALLARWREKLEIDQLLVSLDGAGGDAALADFSARVHKLGYLFGLRAESPEGIIETLPRLKEKFAPDLLLVPAAPSLMPGGLAGPTQAIGEKIQTELGIAGTDGAGETWTSGFGYLEGILSGPVLRPIGAPALPLFAFGFGHTARMTVRPEDAVEPDQPEKVLRHLLFGEVPLYALPPAGGSRENEAAPGDSRWCLARGDGGWSEGQGLTVRERFVKNTFEVLTHVARTRFRAPLLFHRYLTDDRTVEEVHYGPDLRIIVNFGDRDYSSDEADFKLPRWGFWVQEPMFHAFHATRAHGVDYATPALFTVRSLEGKMFLRAEAVRIYHGFGPAKIALGGKDFDVKREATVKIW